MTLPSPYHKILKPGGGFVVADTVANVVAALGGADEIAGVLLVFSFLVVPSAAAILHVWPDAAIASARLGAEAAVVLLSHDPKFDRPGLVAALRSDAGYIGAIGSRRTNEERMGWLRAEGFSDDELRRVHAPIGLDIGARTAEETALAILGEIVAERRGRPGTSLSARAPAALARP